MTEKTLSEAATERLHNQLIRLGDMMGDGLHHEADGRWISTEYRRVAKLLFPEEYAARRKAKAERINTQMAKLLSEKTCKCGCALKQARSGSRICHCVTCGNRYMAKTKRK